ncbi:MAG: flavodoxin family protein [Sedimentisphaerales bacterium]|nr:flavodoxin family protein [Sedimentisphaerales bacterium]
MAHSLNRRMFLGGLGAAAAVQTAKMARPAQAGSADKVLIVGVSCSPRKGKTTSRAVQEALHAAEKVDGRIETELLDLGGMEIKGWAGGAGPDEGAETVDDFAFVEPVLRDPRLGGLIIGSPSYFRSMSSLCKAFLERCAVLRSPTLLLADKPMAVVAVGAYRNGGQELVIEQIQTAMLCHEVLCVGGKPRAHQGATLWNAYNDDITKDELGMESARKVGIRVAEAALKITGTPA